ncbi:MAG: lamin tail domain-containing protein [Anaerolineae bacterium]|nr:lamin tail domain-containing protein [Anaerolineae bacterium]
MKRQNPLNNLLILIALPAIVSLVVSLLVLWFWDARQPDEQVIMLPTYSGTAQSATGAEAAPEAQGVEDSADGSAVEAVSEGLVEACQNPIHIVESGQTLGAISRSYNFTPEEVTAANLVVDATFNPDMLYVGQSIVIPMCGIPTLEPTVASTETPVPPRVIPTPGATATEPAGGAVSVRIAGVVDPGDITREGVEIINRSGPIDLEGWTLTNGGRLVFTFPAFRLFTQGSVTVLTGVGQNSAVNLVWGRTQPVWEVGDVIFLYDPDGELRDFYEITQ